MNSTLDFPDRAVSPHLAELGHNGLTMVGVHGGFANDLRIVNADNGIDVAYFSKQSTNHDVQFGAGPIRRSQRQPYGHIDMIGHHGISVGLHAHDNLVEEFSFPHTFAHDLTLGHLSSGNVFRNGDGSDLTFDHHRNGPFENLFSNIDVGDGSAPFFSGGDACAGPNAGAREVFWNVFDASGEPVGRPQAQSVFPEALVIPSANYELRSVEGMWLEAAHLPGFMGPVSPLELQASQHARALAAPSRVETRRLSGVTNQPWRRVDWAGVWEVRPVALADMQTRMGGDTAAIRMRPVDSSAVEVIVEEERSRDEEVIHVAETVGLLALSPGWILDADGRRIGQVGRMPWRQQNRQTWGRMSLGHEYENPVIIAQIQTRNGGDPSHIRLTAVSSTSFQFKLEEWDYLDGVHVSETIAFVVFEAGTHLMPGGARIYAGTSESMGTGFSSHAFAGANFEQTPLVLSQLQSAVENEAVVTRHRNVTRAGFEYQLQEQESLGATGHVSEMVGVIAIN